MPFGRRSSRYGARGRRWGSALALGLILLRGGDARWADPGAAMGEERASWGGQAQEREIEGELEVLIEERFGRAHPQYVLRHGLQRFRLQGEASALLSARTGMRVRVRGVRRGTDIIVSRTTFEEPPEAQDARSSEILIARRVALLLLNFSDRTVRPYSVEGARQVLATAGEFFRENSYGRLSLVGDVFGWFTLGMSAALCDPFRLAEEAHATVATSGLDLSEYEHLVYVFPQNACPWWGLATIGGAPAAAWINGRLTFDVLAHEFGHGLGLSHSHALECGWVALGTECQVLEYGDTLDVMGMAAGHLSAVHKEQLGWLGEEDASLLPVVADGVFRLAPYQRVGDGPRALKILRSREAGRATWYYVEYRAPFGFDRFLSRNLNVPRGVIVRLGGWGEQGGSFLLDMTPETASWFDPALTVGRTFVDPQTGLVIFVREVTDGGAVLVITGIAR